MILFTMKYAQIYFHKNIVFSYEWTLHILHTFPYKGNFQYAFSTSF